ncbi:MAG: glycosyltransferase family 4 protein [Candidatus Gottesmanbacteria bacterium]
MNILFISALLPYPLHSGGQVRMYNLLKVLSKKHTITLFSFIRNEEEKKYVKELSFVSEVRMVMRGRGMQLKYLLGALGNYPLLLSTYDNRIMQKEIQKELQNKKYDLVHAEPFYVYPSLPKLSIPLVVSEHNVEHTVYEKNARTLRIPFLRPFAFLDAVKVKIWEEIIWKKAHTVVAVSDDDAAIISKITNTKTPVVSNGVDTSYFKYSPRSFDVKHPSFLFVGNFLWAPNKEAVYQLLSTIWPSIIRLYPNARLTIVGKHFPSSLASLVTPSVSVEGYVEDIRDAFKNADVLLAPMGIGGGTKFKILESMAAGILVITTKEGRMGLSGTDGKEFIEAEDTNSYVSAIKQVFENPKKSIQMTRDARILVEKKYDWAEIGEQLNDVWKGAV